MKALPAVVLLAALWGGAARAAMPPVPVPPANPITPQKAVLGKILFWEEQISGDDTVACGTCHLPSVAGGDLGPRLKRNPGRDGLLLTPDDIIGSPGVSHMSASGAYVTDPVFGAAPQVTGRATNPYFGAPAYAPEVFWDGRASSTFTDPLSGTVIIANGGSLESQSLAPIMSVVEMGREGRTWDDVVNRLRVVRPLALADALPPDVAGVLAPQPDYPALFQSAFGDQAITPARIALAIASYERTLVPNDTPWDRFVGGDPAALTLQQRQGWNTFQSEACVICHAPPLFTDNTFRNVGLRPIVEDPGRSAITGNPVDDGRFKVPTLRNVGLKTSFMHNGALGNLPQVIGFYSAGNNANRFRTNEDPLLPVSVPGPQVQPLSDFLANGLTDPRVAQGLFPFDRPALRGGSGTRIHFSANGTTISWPPVTGAVSYGMYRGLLSGLADGDGDGFPDGGYGVCVTNLDPNPSDTNFTDPLLPPPGEGYFYLRTHRDAGGVERGLGITGSGARRPAPAACP